MRARCSCIFHVKISSKDEGIIVLHDAVRTEAFIHRSVMPCQRALKQHLSEFPEKNG